MNQLFFQKCLSMSSLSHEKMPCGSHVVFCHESTPESWINSPIAILIAGRRYRLPILFSCYRDSYSGSWFMTQELIHDKKPHGNHMAFYHEIRKTSEDNFYKIVDSWLFVKNHMGTTSHLYLRFTLKRRGIKILPRYEHYLAIFIKIEIHWS